MKATFTVESITYAEGCTTVSLAIGKVGSGDERMGTRASLELVGHMPLDIQPGQVVMMILESQGRDRNR